MQQDRLDEHGERRGERGTLDAVERDQSDVEADIGGERHDIELDAKRSARPPWSAALRRVRPRPWHMMPTNRITITL